MLAGYAGNSNLFTYLAGLVCFSLSPIENFTIYAHVSNVQEVEGLTPDLRKVPIKPQS